MFSICTDLVFSIWYDIVLSGGGYVVLNIQCIVFSMYCLVSSIHYFVVSHTSGGSQRPLEASGWAPAHSRHPEAASGSHLEAKDGNPSFSCKT